MTIITGNKNKQQEYIEAAKELGIKVKFQDVDLPEINVENPLLIALTKAYEARNFDDDIFVEDTTMVVNGIFVPDIKWKQDKLKNGDRVSICYTGVRRNSKGYFLSYIILEGIIKIGLCDKYQFGFDNIVFVDNKPLGEVKESFKIRKHLLQDVLKAEKYQIDDTQLEYIMRNSPLQNKK